MNRRIFPFRWLARWLAAGTHALTPPTNEHWANAIANEIEHIDDDAEALRWAAGALRAAMWARIAHPGSLARHAVGCALGTIALLFVPLAAMRYTDEVRWTSLDFAVAGFMLFSAGLAFMRIVRRSHDPVYIAATALAVGTPLLLTWANLAVGIIGSENNPLNVMYVAVPIIIVAGAAFTRASPAGMVRVLRLSALTQVMIAIVALIAALGDPSSAPLEIVVVNAWFMALLLASSLLYRSLSIQ
jgi:hypothetical protein